MPDTILQQKIFPYDGAFDATKNPLLISPKDIVDSNNIVYTTYSTKKKRPGLTEAFIDRIPGSRKILAGIDFWRLGSQYVVIYNGKQIIAYDVVQNRFDVISQNFTCPIDAVVHFTTFQGLLIVTFEGELIAPKAWLGYGQLFDLDSTAPIAPFGMVWLNRLWMPDPSIPGRILYSATGTVTFTGGDSGSLDLDVNDNDPDGITAIFPPFFGSLYITKRFSTYKIRPYQFGSTIIFSPTKISDGVGCIAHGGVAAGPGNIFFPSDEGVHYFVSTDKVSEIDSEDFSIPIQPLWIDETNFKRSKYMRGVYDRELKSYLLLYPAESILFPNDLWGYSLVAKKWYRWRDYNQTCLFKYVDRKTKRLRTMAGSRTGDLGYIDSTVTTDYGRPYDISLQSGIICPTGSPNENFSFSSIAPIFSPQLSGEFTLTYKINGEFIETLTFNNVATFEGNELGEEFTLGVSPLGSLPRLICESRNIKGNGMMYEFIVECKGVGDNMDGFELLGLLVDVDRSTKTTGRTAA